MKTAIATLVLTVLATLGTGCTHYANMAQVESPAADGLQVWESSRTDRDGNLRVAVQERVGTDADGCETQRVRKDFYSDDGQLERTLIKRERCGYTVLSVEDRYEDGALTREIQRDLDQDGHAEQRIVRTEDLASGQLTARVAN